MTARRATLGERIAAVEAIRAGRATVPETAARFGVGEADVRLWLDRHATDRTVHLSEFRRPALNATTLARQARDLRQLIARTERTLNLLHARLLASRSET